MESSLRSSSRPSDCAAASAEQLLENLLATEGVIGCFIADADGIVGLQRLPGLVRQTPFFRRAKQILKSYSAAEASLEGSTVRVAVMGGVLFFRRIESLYLCALALTDHHSGTTVKALRVTAANMPGGLKMAPSIPPPPRKMASQPLQQVG